MTLGLVPTENNILPGHCILPLYLTPRACVRAGYQVCYTLVNFLQRDEQNKQARIDYLKGLEESSDGERVEAKDQVGIARVGNRRG